MGRWVATGSNPPVNLKVYSIVVACTPPSGIGDSLFRSGPQHLSTPLPSIVEASTATEAAEAAAAAAAAASNSSLEQHQQQQQLEQQQLELRRAVDSSS